MMSWTESLARCPVALVGITAAMLLLLPVRSTPAAAQVVEGRVVEAEGGGAAAGVLMELTDLQGIVLTRDETDGDGTFSLTAPEPGDFLVIASALGFRTVRGGVFEVGAGGRIQIEIRLQVEPLGLEELTVEVAQGSRLSRAHPLITNGFVERANSGRGRFLTPREIEELQHLDVPKLLERTGRVEIMGGAGGQAVRMRRPRGLCMPLYVIDGVRVNREPDEPWRLLNQADLLGVEVYRSAAEAPLQFGGIDDVDCGVIVIWTRTGAGSH